MKEIELQNKMTISNEKRTETEKAKKMGEIRLRKAVKTKKRKTKNLVGCSVR
jgi:hypothetical protein